MIRFVLPPRPRGLVAVSLCALLCAGPAAAQFDDPRLNEASGTLNANWPPDRPFDHLHMKLEIDIAEMGIREMSAVETLTLSAIGEVRSVLPLDARDLQIRSVEVDGSPAPFEHVGSTLEVTLDPPAQVGTAFECRIEYSGRFEDVDGTGLTWTLGDANHESETQRSPQLHTQGQPNYTQEWLVCHDFPHEKLTTELIVTVPRGYQAISNGRLVDQRDLSNGRARWHWLQNRPHPYYLVSLIVGKFDVVNLSGADWRSGDIWMPVYVPIGQAEHAEAVFGKTPEMMRVFEELFDEPYPWDKYAQACVRDFRWGGMENTSATTLYLRAAYAEPGSQDGLIAHELAHQWFGDLVTCASWEHLWLNEGWATYSEALWLERSEGREAYLGEIAALLSTQRMGNRAFAPQDPAMASRRFGHPDDRFDIADDVYAKGALVLHMLRAKVGDRAFFEGAALFLDRFKHGVVETDDFRHVLEEVSGMSLEQFFDQWVHRPGLPRLQIDLNWGEDAGELVINVEQTQRIDSLNPAYVFDLPIVLTTPEGELITEVVEVDSRQTTVRVPLLEQPRDISIDPDLHVTCAHQVRVPTAMTGDGSERQIAESE